MNHLRNLREIATVTVAVIAAVAMFVVMRVAVAVIAFTTARQMHIKLHPINCTFPAIFRGENSEQLLLEADCGKPTGATRLCNVKSGTDSWHFMTASPV